MGKVFIYSNKSKFNSAVLCYFMLGLMNRIKHFFQRFLVGNIGA